MRLGFVFVFTFFLGCFVFDTQSVTIGRQYEEDYDPYAEGFSKFCQVCKNYKRTCTKALKPPKPTLRKNSNASTIEADTDKILEIRITNHTRNTQNPEYMCSFQHVKETGYINQFEIVNTTAGFHHLMLIGCSDLPEGFSENMPRPCVGPFRCENDQAIYAWVEDGPLKTGVPPNTGFKIGPLSNVKYLAVHVHYSPVDKEGIIDNSGFRIKYQVQEPKYLMGHLVAAGHYNLETGTRIPAIPPKSKNFRVGLSCITDSSDSITAYAYQTHAHNWGIDTAVYINRRDGSPTQEIIRRDPQKAEMYYYLNQTFVINPTDVLIFICTYNTENETQPLPFSTKARNEMCGFQILYYTNSRDKNDHHISCSDHDYPELVDTINNVKQIQLPQNLPPKSHPALRGMEMPLFN